MAERRVRQEERPPDDERRRPTDDYNGNGRSDRIHIWARAIGMVGIPGVLAIGFGYVGATKIPAIERELVLQTVEAQQTRATIAAGNEQLRQLNERVDRFIRIAIIGCQNAAKDDDARNRCLER